MQSLMQQTSEIVALAGAMNAPQPKTCAVCTDVPCWYHRDELIRSRRLTRAQWQAMRHRNRQAAYEREQQDRDLENFRESAGYEMPYSMRLAAGYADPEGDE